MSDIDKSWSDLLRLHARSVKSNNKLRQGISRLDELIERGVEGKDLDKATRLCSALSDDQQEDNRAMHLKLAEVLEKLSANTHETGNSGPSGP
jgi:hypothetical protein